MDPDGRRNTNRLRSRHAVSRDIRAPRRRLRCRLLRLHVVRGPGARHAIGVRKEPYESRSRAALPRADSLQGRAKARRRDGARVSRPRSFAQGVFRGNHRTERRLNSSENLIAIRDLKVDFRLDRTTISRAVKGISFDIPVNSTVALVGESGSGKSVTALAILGLLPKENSTVSPDGRVVYGGRNLLALPPGELQNLRGADISMIFQEPMSSLNPVFSVGFQLAEVLTRHLGMTGRQARARALELLRDVGIPEPETKIDAYPFQLSGGQQQRAMIAIAIACEPKLLIADEPTTALDVTIQKQILDLIAALQKRLRMSVLCITHDLALVGEIADYVVVMREGEIKEQGRVEQIFEARQHPYTRALLLCRPQLERRPRRLPVIDDFLKPGPLAGGALEERSRGLRGDEEIILEVRHLGKSFYSREGLFGKREFKAVKDVSFKLARGKTLGIVGESGSGKTTVALTLLRLRGESSGEALFDGKDLLSIPQDERSEEHTSEERRVGKEGSA